MKETLGKPKYTKIEFSSYCDAQMESLKVAIDRKSRGSPCEDAYFLEHLDSLKKFFLNVEVLKEDH